MKKLWTLSLLAVPMAIVAAALPENPAPEGYEHWSQGTFAPSEQALAVKAASDPHKAATQQLGSFANEYFLLAHREADGQAEWHENEVDIFVVQSGSATLVVGGTIPNAETTAPHEKRGNAIENGVKEKLAKGDVVRIPAKTAHQLQVENGKEFTYFVVKVKGY